MTHNQLQPVENFKTFLKDTTATLTFYRLVCDQTSWDLICDGHELKILGATQRIAGKWISTWTTLKKCIVFPEISLFNTQDVIMREKL